MHNEVDVILQGGIWDCTYKAALQYSELDFVKSIIISTSVADKEATNLQETSKIKVVAHDEPSYEGGGNMNYQIVSTKRGLEEVTARNVVKSRSDQIITNKSMERLHRFYHKFWIPYDDVECDGPIFVIGQMNNYPYHPQDHIFWGTTADINRLFTLPDCNWPTYVPPVDFTKILRVPIHLGGHYYKRFDKRVQQHLDNPYDYLVDQAPRFQEAMNLSDTLRDKVFKCFPRVDLYWDKYRDTHKNYPYHFYHSQGEYCYEGNWE